MAHTSCVGFGLERIALALYRRHGFDRARWPSPVREALGSVMRSDLAARSGDLRASSAARDERAWPESNCYVDLWIELLHTSGLEPLAALPFTFTVDIEGDQWTFFKFPLADLYALYGVEVIELNVWRPLIAHIEEQLALGRPAIVEVDAFYLPDTAGTTYHAEHVKTSIAVQALDAAARRLGYFHNAGYYELEGGDFAGVFRLERGLTDPHTAAVRGGREAPGASAAREGRTLVAASLDLLARAARATCRSENPFRRYADALPRRSRLACRPAARAVPSATPSPRFASAARRSSSAARISAGSQANGEHGLERIAAACDVIATTAKALQFKTARARQTPIGPSIPRRCSPRWPTRGTRR